MGSEGNKGLLLLSSVMANSGNGAIVPLNGSNFPTWKIQCRMALLKQGIWKIVDGTELSPDEIEQPANYRKYCDRRDRALSTIVLAVDTSLLYLLGDPQDPVEVWKKLCDQFQKKTWANKLTLRRRLYSLKLKDGEAVQSHIKQIVEIFDELAVIGQPIEEEDRVVHILSSLPESFNMLVTALEASTEVPSLELVTERLLHEERKLKEKSDPKNVSTELIHDALFVGSQRSRSGGPICFYCGEKGHIKRFCEEWKKKFEERNNSGQFENKKEPEIANFSYVDRQKQSSSDSEDIECIALVSKVTVRNKKGWIVDSAATNHLCCDIKQFSSLSELEEDEKIKVGNGKYVTASKEGTVELLIRTASKVRKFMLTNVLFVPDLKFNLFSVSKAAEAGIRTEFDIQGCKFVEKKSNKIVGSAKKTGNLYYLNSASNEGRNNTRNIRRKQMETALISIRTSNFQEEMMRRMKPMNNDVLTNYSNTIKEDVV